MECVCFVLQVKPDCLQEYRALHRLLWPEMLAAPRESGWENDSLFLRDDGLLIGLAKRQVNRWWQHEMAEYFVEPNGSSQDRIMNPREEVFHL